MKVAIIVKINQQPVISWKGTLRPSIDETGIYPRAEHGPIPISIATGGTPESSLRAGAFGLPITYAIIGGNPRRFKRHIEIYKSVARSYGHNLRNYLLLYILGAILLNRKMLEENFSHL